jgi:hypothetical protein
MKQDKLVLALALLLETIASTSLARAQTNPTAVQPLQLSAFGGASGVFTGLESGKNLSFTAGVDLGLPPHAGIRPTIEVRGLYPVDNGVIDSQKDVLGGLKVAFLIHHRLQPYGNFLFGRGEMHYGAYGYLYNNYVYVLTTTYVYSPGAGIDYRFSDHFALKVDGQWQRWAGPAPTSTGTIYAKVGTIGLVYYFNFNHGIIH